jgi:hypothetical protein
MVKGVRRKGERETKSTFKVLSVTGLVFPLSTY